MDKPHLTSPLRVQNLPRARECYKHSVGRSRTATRYVQQHNSSTWHYNGSSFAYRRCRHMASTLANITCFRARPSLRLFFSRMGTIGPPSHIGDADTCLGSCHYYYMFPSPALLAVVSLKDGLLGTDDTSVTWPLECHDTDPVPAVLERVRCLPPLYAHPRIPALFIGRPLAGRQGPRPRQRWTIKTMRKKRACR